MGKNIKKYEIEISSHLGHLLTRLSRIIHSEHHFEDLNQFIILTLDQIQKVFRAAITTHGEIAIQGFRPLAKLLYILIGGFK